MKNVLPFALTALLAACGVPAETGETAEVGVSRSALTQSWPFNSGYSRFTTGYGALRDTTENGILGWSGPMMQTPVGAIQTNAMTFDVEGGSASAEAVLTWFASAPSTGDHRISGPAHAFIDGYARASTFFQPAGVDVYVRVRVLVNGGLRHDVWKGVAVVDTNHGERTSSFSSLTLPIAHDFDVSAKTRDQIKYEVVLFTRASLGSIGSAFVGIRDFGVPTNALPNTSYPITLSAP